MKTREMPSEEDLSAEAVFDALQDQLPPQGLRRSHHSELEFSDPQSLKTRLDRGELIVASYTNSWLQGLERLDDFFVVWTFGSLAALLALTIVGGLLGFVGGGSALEAIVLFGLSALIGFGLSIRYSRILPPMAEQSVTVINGKTRELVYACRIHNDEPVATLLRVPLSDLTVAIFWGQVADHFPSFLSVYLQPNSSTGDEGSSWASLCLATVDHNYPAAVPVELERKAKQFAEVLGASYAGLKSESA